MILRITASCMLCGLLGEGTTADPPTSRRFDSRAAELDSAAKTHCRNGHPTWTVTIPVNPP